MIRDEADLTPACAAAAVAPVRDSSTERFSTPQHAAPQKIRRIWLDEGKFAGECWMRRSK
jgi:hypothetical protein